MTFDHSLITCHSTFLIYFFVINWLLLTNSLCLWVILTCDFSCPFGAFSHALIVLDAFIHLNSFTIVKCDLSSPWIFGELLLFYDIRLTVICHMVKVSSLMQGHTGQHSCNFRSSFFWTFIGIGTSYPQVISVHVFVLAWWACWTLFVIWWIQSCLIPGWLLYLVVSVNYISV